MSKLDDDARRRLVIARELNKAAQNPECVAYWVRIWCERYRRTLGDVADELGAEKDEVAALLLCRAPRYGLHSQDMKTLAGFARCNVVVLARIVYLCEPLKPPYAKKRKVGKPKTPK